MTEQNIHTDRRKTMAIPPDQLELLRQVHESNLALDSKLTQHMRDGGSELAAAITKLVNDSFPEGDPAGHRRYHEMSIKKAEAQAAFWEKLRVELAKWGLIGFIGWVLLHMWQAFVQGPRP